MQKETLTGWPPAKNLGWLGRGRLPRAAAAAALALWWAAGAQASGDALVGKTEGAAAISDGHASYSIDISAPPGIGSLRPELAISYSQGGGSLELGAGFSISGLHSSAISRCPRTVVHDGAFHSVRLSNDDAYCLDGARLILFSGEHGAQGAEYRTEIASYQRIRIAAATASHPTRWTVRRKSGEQLTYDAGAQVTHDGPSGARLQWRLSRMTDPFGNAVTWEWAASAGKLGERLTAVKYGYLSGA